MSLYDSDQKQLSDALEFIRLELARLESQGFLRGQLGAKDQAALVQSAESLEKCVEGAVHVQVLGNRCAQVLSNRTYHVKKVNTVHEKKKVVCWVEKPTLDLSFVFSQHINIAWCFCCQVHL